MSVGDGECIFVLSGSKQVPHGMNDHYRMIEAKYWAFDYFKEICSCLAYHSA